MITTMKKHYCFWAVAMLLVACTKQPIPQASYDIIPQPKEVLLNDDKSFVLQAKTKVYYAEGLQR